MNLFNRVLAVLCLLGLIVALIAGIFQLTLTVDTLHNALNGVMSLAVAYPVAFWAVSAVLLFAAILLLILEFRRSQLRTVRVQQGSGSIVELSVESVIDSLQYHVAQVPGVRAVEPRVTGRGASISVFLDLETEPDIELPAKSEEIVQLVHELVESRLGLRLAGVRANVRQGAFEQSAPAAVAAPAMTVPPASAAGDEFPPVAGAPALQS